MASSGNPRLLRLRARREDPSSTQGRESISLFARLSPSVVDALHQDALCALSMQEGYDGWSIATSDSPIDFLPLSIKLSDATTIYVSYNGGGAAAAAASEEEDEPILELPASLIPEGISQHSTVEVSALASIGDADTLHVEPLTCEDWELLETCAEFLEEGALLQQISVVYSGQSLPLWVGGKDAAWIRVLPQNFQTRASLWPGPSKNNTTTCVRCLRLVRDTRVVVNPKARHRNCPQSSPPLRVIPTSEDYSNSANELAESLGKEQVSTTPRTLWVNPATREKISGLNPEDTTALVIVWNAAYAGNEDTKRSCVLQLSFSNLVEEGNVAVHRLTRTKLGVVALVGHLFVRVMTPIEVSRGSLVNQSGKALGVSLSKVNLVEVRTAMKWRYPGEANSFFALGSLESPVNRNEADLSNEPVEHGSFILTNLHGCESILCQVAFRDADGGDENSCAANRCFVSRGELPAVDQQSTSRSKSLSKQTVLGPDVAYELPTSSHLVNLLPEGSIIPSELIVTKEYRERAGDTLVCGEVGSGKTHTALVLAAVARFARNTSTFYLDCKRLKKGRGIRMKNILLELNQLFHDAAACQGGSVVILDDLDDLSPNLENDNNTEDSAQSHQVNPVALDQAKLVGDTVRSLLETEACRDRVSVIITCRDRNCIIPGVASARPGFAGPFETPTLTGSERELILWNMIASGPSLRQRDTTDVFRSWRIGRKTDSFRPRDLQVLSSKVRHALQATKGKITPEKIAACASKALESFVPLRQLTVSEGATTAVDWSSIGGLFRVKEELTSAILNPAKYRRIYEKAKIRLPRGVMVFGSPGCGKSYLIPALAKKCGFSLVTCRGPELLDRYIGASESKVRELFARAAASSPSILFFDEIDALAPRRGSDRTGVTDRVVNQLLTLLDGVEDSSAKGLVYIVAATSRPDIVDPALLRPGRLEKHVYAGSPESEDEYNDLIAKIASRYSLDDSLSQSIASGRFLDEAKRLCGDFERFSCADFKAAFDTAQLLAIHEILERDHVNENESVAIGIQHAMQALGSTRPSLPDRDYRMLMEVYKPFRKRLSSDVPSGEPSSSTATNPHVRKPGRDLRTSLR